MIQSDISDLPKAGKVEADFSAEQIERYALLRESFFGFRESPFNNTPDPDLFFMSPAHREILTSMLFGIYQRRGFIVVSGEIGAGKTTLCRHLLRQISPQVETAVILNPKISALALLAQITKDFGIQCKGRTKKDYFEALHTFLLKGAENNRNACIIIDEAQWLNPKVLEELRFLSNFETTKQKLLQIILIGQPELKDKLMAKSLLQLRQRVGVFTHLRALDFDETKAYIYHRMQRVSDDPCKVAFGDDVVQQIFEKSKGVPRLINSICDHLLMAAYFHETQTIDVEIAEKAFKELHFICEGEIA